MSPDIKEAQVRAVSLKTPDTSDYFKDTYGMVIKKLVQREGMESARPITGAHEERFRRRSP
jgi:hypothetical protein